MKKIGIFSRWYWIIDTTNVGQRLEIDIVQGHLFSIRYLMYENKFKNSGHFDIFPPLFDPTTFPN